MIITMLLLWALHPDVNTNPILELRFPIFILVWSFVMIVYNITMAFKKDKRKLWGFTFDEDARYYQPPSFWNSMDFGMKIFLLYIFDIYSIAMCILDILYDIYWRKKHC